MSEILLVNPRRRRRKTTTARKRRRNPVRRRRTRSRRRRRNPIAANPRRRRRSYSRRRRSNPSPRLSSRYVQTTVMNAVPGAIGALGLDVIMGYVPLPANFKAGIAGYATKGIAAVLLGFVASKAGVKAATATRMTEGALTVMIHGALRQAVTQYAPQVALGDMGYAGSGWNPNYDDGMGAYLSSPALAYDENGNGMGEYLSDDEELMAY